MITYEWDCSNVEYYFKEVINKIKVFQEKENPSESGDEDVG
jgi:hypothetical protein